MPADLSERVLDGFRSAFDREPEGLWSAPGRVSFAGDHTDVHDGVSFAFAIDRRTAVAVARRDDDAITVATDLTDERAVSTLSTPTPDEPVADWRSYPLGMIRAVLEHAQADADRASDVGTGLDVFLSTDLPIGGGLAASASVCAAIGIALRDVWQLELSSLQLAALGRDAEVRSAGATSGIADHVTVLAARTGHDVFFDARGNDASLIAVPGLASHGIVDLLVDTRETHRNWSETFREGDEACRAVAAELGCQSLREVRLPELEAARDRLDPREFRQARHVVTEIQRTLDLTRILRTEGPARIGDILNASQASLRDDYGVSTERIDDTCDVARQHGALGARMSGTGRGGTVLVLVPADLRGEFVEALEARYAERGWETPTVFDAIASDGARRDR